MAAGVQDIEVGQEEAMLWLPSHVHDGPILETKNKKDDVKYHYHHRHRSKLPTEPFPPHSKASSRRHHKPRYSTNWASGGPGMQAIFLDSGQKSCGTGVFLPQRVGTNFQSSRRPDSKNNKTTRGGELNSFNNSNRNYRNGKDDVSTKRCVISLQNENCSPEIFLPKEWTY
ncbi:hypothetical protein CRYUN_Cryun23aG0089400 [Craigia yunnanensis]